MRQLNGGGLQDQCFAFQGYKYTAKDQWKGKVQKNASFPFSGQERAFLYKIVHRGIRNSRNFHHRKRNRQRNQVAKFLNNFQVHFVLYNQPP